MAKRGGRLIARTAELSVDEAGMWSLAVDVRSSDDTVLICEEAGGMFGAVMMGITETTYLVSGLRPAALCDYVQNTF